MDHIMLDLETIATSYDAAIVQIGACYFNIETGVIGKKFEVTIDVNDSIKYGAVDPNTMLWWMEQNPKAIQNVFKSDKKYLLKDGLSKLNKFLDFKKNAKIWSHAVFDPPILANAFKATGIKPKYHFRNMVDLRTMSMLSKILNIQIKSVNTQSLIAHNALDDCINQVNYLTCIYNKLIIDRG